MINDKISLAESFFTTEKNINIYFDSENIEAF